jgi:hypothetical protein
MFLLQKKKPRSATDSKPDNKNDQRQLAGGYSSAASVHLRLVVFAVVVIGRLRGFTQ